MAEPEIIYKWMAQDIPPTKEEVYDQFTTNNGLFLLTEGICWDFKQEWPYSHSNDYFAGIARLVCAYGNSHGGVIVFGVHDKLRTGGHNKVIINFDKFQTSINQLLGLQVVLSVETYSNDKAGDITILFVPRRLPNCRPYKFNKKLEKYEKGVVWIRKGHEVVRATPIHYPLLFCHSNVIDYDQTNYEIDGSLPPSPATLKRFVGRVSVMEELFNWLQNSDEPRTYLYGKGGSGKSTIAFEFAKILKDWGSQISIYDNEKIDAVVFLSAKELELQTLDGSIMREITPDFSNEAGLYRRLLYYGKWILNEDTLENYSLDDLKKEIKEFLDISSVVIFLDDIDTLTTKGVDPGIDFLYRTLCRSRRRSKVIYTLRNAPTQSLTNSIEVPGLNDGDYISFVSDCCNQFNVPEPPIEFREGKLSQISERRPLVIESVIALYRTSGSYQKSLELFEKTSGEYVRDYVFLREWDALSSDNIARLLLAALSDLKKPTSFLTLESILQIDCSRVRDAIGAVSEMFLQCNHAGDETLFSLAPLTMNFIVDKKRALSGYSNLNQRIKAYERTAVVSNPHVAQLISRAERFLSSKKESNKAEEAWRMVNDPALAPNITEDPLFKSFYGYVAANCIPPKLHECRQAFKYAKDMNYECNFRYLLAWFIAEKGSGSHEGWCEHISDLVISGKTYKENEKIEMISRKASTLFALGKEQLYTDYHSAMKSWNDALVLDLKAFKLNILTGNSKSELSERHSQRTANVFFHQRYKSEGLWALFDDIKNLGKNKDIYLDPLDDLFSELSRSTSFNQKSKESIQRARQHMKGMVDLLSNKEIWASGNCANKVVELFRKMEQELSIISQK